MKNLKKMLFGLAALVLAFGLVFSVSAFKGPAQKTSTLKYRFIGTNSADLQDPSKWLDVSSEANPVPCETGSVLPCIVQFENNEYTDIEDFYTQHDTAAEMFKTTRVISKKD